VADLGDRESPVKAFQIPVEAIWSSGGPSQGPGAYLPPLSAWQLIFDRLSGPYVWDDGQGRDTRVGFYSCSLVDRKVLETQQAIKVQHVGVYARCYLMLVLRAPKTDTVV